MFIALPALTFTGNPEANSMNLFCLLQTMFENVIEFVV